MLKRILMSGVLVASCLAQDTVERGLSLMKSGDYAGAVVTLEGVVDRDPTNLKALQALGAATLMSFGATNDRIDKNRKLDEAASVLKKVIALSPGDSDAYYTLGVIAWTKSFPDLRNARTQLGMKPQDPGPLTDFGVRQEMRARFEPVIEGGIASLQKAIDIDSKNSDAMAYMNLLLRSRADIRDTTELAAADIKAADGWVNQSLEARRAQGAIREHSYFSSPPPPPPPGGMPIPGSIRIGGNVAASNLITQVPPVYPPLARQARIQGTVRFNAVIGKDGHVQNLTLVSGHPLLVVAAQQAVQQWAYRPTLLNGQPTEVITTIDVNFALNQ